MTSTKAAMGQRNKWRPPLQQPPPPCLLLVASLALLLFAGSCPAEGSPQGAASPVSWMTQVAAMSGQAPKMKIPPVIQLDTGSKYYKTMLDGMVLNFKKAVSKASDRTYSMSNITSIKPITLVGGGGGGGQPSQRISVHELQIEGLGQPRVNNVYVNKKNMKLHVVFGFKSIKVTGRCSSSSGGGGGGGPQKPASSPIQSAAMGGKPAPLLEATNWNSSWSASLMNMIGREHFDLSKVHASHSQQRLSLNLNGCSQFMHDKLRTALLDRVKQSVDQRLVEIMEIVMMQQAADGTTSDDFPSSSSSNGNEGAPKPKERGKRAPQPVNNNHPATVMQNDNAFKSSPKRPSPVGYFSDGAAAAGGRQQRALKRTKRQTPCQQGEELDDYVDQLFRFGTRIVRAMEPVTTPNATIELPDYNVKIFLYDGKGTRAYKFRRAKPAWVFCSNETISLGLTIEVEELRVAYKYRVISGTRLLFDGDLEAKLSPKVQVQFSQAIQEEDSEEPVQQRVDRVRVFRLGKVHVIIRGLGNLTHALSLIVNGYLNDNQEELQPTFRMVEGDAVRLINRLLANVNVPLLSVV